MPARQQQVLGVPGIGVAGDFSDMNPRYTVLAGPGGLVAGSAGVTIGAFAWLFQSAIDPDNAATIVNSFGSGVPDGFVPRPGQQAIITPYLADSTMTISQGLPVWVASGGGFLVKNSGTTYVTINQKCYAFLSTGLASFAATATPATASNGTTSVAAGTWSATGSISGNVMTLGTVTGSQGAAVGSLVTGTNVATGTTIVAQLPDVAGGSTIALPRGAGRYAVSIGEQTVASGTSLSGTFGVLTVTSTVTGTIYLGALVAGSGIPTGSIITDTLGNGNTNLTGAGIAGTYVTNLTGTGGTGTITFTTNAETKWFARSQGAAGELIKISEISQ